MGGILVKILLKDSNNNFFDKKIIPNFSDKRNIYLPKKINQDINDEYVYVNSPKNITSKVLKLKE